MVPRYSRILASMVPAVLSWMLSRSEPKLVKPARAAWVESMACKPQGGVSQQGSKAVQGHAPP